MIVSDLEAQDMIRRVEANSKKKLPVDTLFSDINIENKKLNNPEAFSEIVNILRMKVKNNRVIFLKGNIPSSKNSKEIQSMFTGKSACCNSPYIKNAVRDYTCTKCHKSCELGKVPRLGNSKVVEEYIKNNSQQYIDNRPLFLELIKDLPKPIYSIRDSNRRFDFINEMQIVCDLLVTHNWVADDDCLNLIPVHLGFHKDSVNPGMILTVLKDYPDKLISLV